MDSHTEACPKCGRSVIYARTIAGARIAFDAEPQSRFVEVEPNRFGLQDVYQSHYITCPEAARTKPAPRPASAQS